MCRRWCVALALGLAVSRADDAAARPSIWQTAREPGALRSERMLEETERRIEAAPDLRVGDPFALRADLEREAAIASLEDQGASRSSDPRLHLALGQLWMPIQTLAGEQGGDYRKAVAELEWVVRHAPDGSLVAQAWLLLSTAYAKLGIRDREREAYDRVLDLDWRPEVRASTFYNRGDAELEAGQLDAAIADYRRSLPLMVGPVSGSLVYWSLGLALERSGDLPSALDAIAMAQSLYSYEHFTSALDEPSVFFVPAYEKSYLEALGELACARDAPSTVLARQSYENARTYFEDYVVKATPDKHLGLSNAKLELAMIERKLEKLDASGATSRRKLDASRAIRPGCPMPESPVPPPPRLQLPVIIPPIGTP